MRAITIILMVISYSIVLMLGAAGNNQQHPAIAVKIESNFTSTTCINDKPCVTRTCINSEPCHIVTSNSTNIDNNSTNKKKNTIAPSFPQASI